MCLWYMSAVNLSLCSCFTQARQAACELALRAAREARIPKGRSLVDGLAKLMGGNHTPICCAGSVRGGVSPMNTSKRGLSEGGPSVGASSVGDSFCGKATLSVLPSIGDMHHGQCWNATSLSPQLWSLVSLLSSQRHLAASVMARPKGGSGLLLVSQTTEEVGGTGRGQMWPDGH